MGEQRWFVLLILVLMILGGLMIRERLVFVLFVFAPFIAIAIMFISDNGRSSLSEKDIEEPETKEVQKSETESVSKLKEWKLVWFVDFQEFDETKWQEVDEGDNYNAELQYYSPNNIEIRDGKLHLIARKEEYLGHSYTSGKVTTKNKFSFQYGKVVVTAKHPKGKGLFPAIWMLPKGKAFPEVDIMEAIGSQPSTVYYVNHWQTKDGYNHSFKTYQLKSPLTFHSYSIEWSSEQIKWFVDGELIFTSTEGIPREPMHFILNLAVGGNWPGSPNALTEFPSAFVIEELKIYKKGE